MLHNILQIPCQKIISGGQTGVDRGALDACISLKFPCGGWCPKGRLAEDGEIPLHYPLKETQSTTYAFRTKMNVSDSDGTLILFEKNLTGGTLLTKQFAESLGKPYYCLAYSTIETRQHIVEIIKWMKKNSIFVLNLAGPRQSEWSQAYEQGLQITKILIGHIKKSPSGESEK